MYVVTIGQLVEWMKNPLTLEQMLESDVFGCGDLPKNNCPEANHNTCVYKGELPIEQSEVYMKICEGSCPKNYPYLGNVDGEDPY